MREMRFSMKVWDAPVRLFHWSIVLLVFSSWLTQHEGWMQYHFYSGYAIAALVLFRVVWGIVGSDTARFARFVRSPFAALRHLAHLTRREPDNEIGHNPAGGWMVVVLLLLLAVLVATGLCANDQVMTYGPFAYDFSQGTSDWLTHIHVLAFTALEVAVALHVLALLAYAVFKRQNLVRPMITGKKRLPAAFRPPRMASPALAAAILLAAAMLVAVVIGTFSST